MFTFNSDAELRESLRQILAVTLDTSLLQRFTYRYLSNSHMDQAARIARAIVAETAPFQPGFVLSMSRLGCRLAYAAVWLETEHISGNSGGAGPMRPGQHVMLLVSRISAALDAAGHYGHLQFAEVFNDRLIAYTTGFHGLEVLLHLPADNGALRGLVVERMAIAAADGQGLMERLARRFRLLRNLGSTEANTLYARICRTVEEACANDPWTADAVDEETYSEFEDRVKLSEATELALLMGSLPAYSQPHPYH